VLLPVTRTLTNRYAIVLLCLVLAGCQATPVNQSQAAAVAPVDALLEQARDLQTRGFSQQALPLFQQAATLARQLPPAEQTKSRLGLARSHYEAGHYGVAIELLEQVLAQTSPAPLRVEALNQLATIYSTLNNPGKARDYFDQAEVAAAGASTGLQASLVANRLRHEMDYANRQVLPALLGRSWLLLDRLDSESGGAEIRISLAMLYRRATLDYAQDDVWLSRALPLLLQVAGLEAVQQDNRLLSYALGYQGQLLLEAGATNMAVAQLQTAAFLAHSSQAYESAYLWEWQLARASRQGQQTDIAISQYYRAISTLERVRQALIDGSPFTFHQKIQPLFTELSDLLLQAASQGPVAARQARLQQVQLILEQAKSAELQDYFQNDCVIPDESLDLGHIEPATAVIYPVILDDRLVMLVNIGSEVHQFERPVGRVELEALVNDFRYVLQDDLGDDDYEELGEMLYELLLADAEPLLQASHISTLLFVPDGVLRTIPMSALFDGGQFVIENYAVATTPGISLTLPRPLDVQAASLFAGGVSDAVQGFVALPGVPSEIANLKSLYGASTLQNDDFITAAIAEQLASAEFSIVHIATHGHFDSNPQQSYLLAYDDKLSMDALAQSISGRQGSEHPLELLVLSACETAAGDQRAALGLAGVALKAGARSAMASLWQISDAATVEIIDTFYAEVTTKGVSKAKALQLAQLKLIAQPRFRHPNYWAPFLLIGNWL